MKTCKEIAEMWNVTERTVTTFCKSGRIPGAVKNGKSWQIPDDARKPVDGRVSSEKYPVIFLTLNQSMIKALCSGISGEGRYDISLIPRGKRYPGIIIELKWKKGLDEEALEQLSEEALDQIDDKEYDFEMREDGVKNISKFGITF